MQELAGPSQEQRERDATLDPSKKRNIGTTFSPTSRKKLKMGDPQEEDKLFEDLDELEEKPSKMSVATQMLRYFHKNWITSMNQLYELPMEEWEKFATHPRFNSMCTNYFGIVGGMLQELSFFDVFQRNPLANLGNIPGKIDRLLAHHGIEDKEGKMQLTAFIYGLISVVEKKNGKRNAFVLTGRSNAGKSQFIEGFIRAYFLNGYGSPSNNIRSGFPWADCIGKRVILWEEPFIDARQHLL